jgi:hypothetical protein
MHQVRNSSEFIKTFGSLQLGPQDLMVSFDVISLFTKVPIDESLDLLGRLFDENILALFRHVLNSTYFIFGGQFYEQMDGVAMGSPLSLVIADFFMEDFEKKALQSAPHRPTCWFQYVDDTFVVWPHGQEKLTDFLTHLNSLNSKIQFTMETEIDGYLPFLDIHIYSRSNGSLGHKVYRKPTHAYISMPAHFIIRPINRLS